MFSIKKIKFYFVFIIFILIFLTKASVSFASNFVSAIALGTEPKYAENFRFFDYTSSKAKSGGELRLAAMGSFDKVNPFTLKGIPARGLMQLVFEPLAIASLDEPMTMYGLIAEKMSLSKDGLSMTFLINPEAKFSNDDPVLASDVEFSYKTLVSDQSSPIWRNYWADVKSVEVMSKYKIRFNFRKKNRELHMIIASLPVFSSKWLANKDFSKLSTKFPIATGPYRVKKLDLGKSIMFEKRDDYWGISHPTRTNQFNFSTISFKYYKDAFARLEAFKADEFDFIHENVSKNWARSYLGKAFKSGERLKKEFPNSNPAGMQGYIFNIRNPIFKDKNVRKAITLAMDFEWMNRQLFYNQYIRSYSYFTNSQMAASGTASDLEVALLNKISKKINKNFDPEILGSVPIPPDNSGNNALRINLRKAKKLLETAGWKIENGELVNKEGQKFKFEILLDSRGWERVVAPFSRNLRKLGITAKTRVTDISLYKKRIDNFEFDMLVHWYLSSQNPGNELYFRFGSLSADQKGSDNFIGLKDPFVDEIIEKILLSKKRSDLIVSSKLLDRVLLFGYYSIPHWHNKVHRVAYDKDLKRPQNFPLYYAAEDWAMSTWWWNGDNTK